MVKNCPDWLHNAVMYEIYPQSFYDSNGDGIGDLPGIIQKLDYIERLGVNLIWLNPMYDSPFRDAGYDISDYYKVAPRYGTNADAKRLFSEAKKRGIRVCLDLVVGHTSVDCAWFKESAKPLPNKYSNWYIWTDSWICQNPDGMRLVNGYSQRNGCYVTNFFYSQPALNHGFAKPNPACPWQLPVDHPDVRAVREEVKSIMRFWLDMGASGFRCDMASSMVKKDPGYKATADFWREMRDMLDKDYPEAFLVSEWGDPVQALNAGFHLDFMSCHRNPADTSLFRAEPSRNILPEIVKVESGRSFFDKRGAGDVTIFLKYFDDFFSKTKHKGYLSLNTGNHDLSRLNVNRSPKELELIFAFILTMPGVPMFYYGEEIGMRNQSELHDKEGGYPRTGARTPMQWTEGRNAGFSTAPTTSLYLPVDKQPHATSVQAMEKDHNSLLHRVRQLVALRRSTAALQGNEPYETVYAKPGKYPYVYLRKKGRERILVALNPSSAPVQVKISVEHGGEAQKALLGRGATLSGSNGKYQLDMKGVSYGIFAV